MALTPELYETIVRIVDQRVGEVKVTREDFDKLARAVSELGGTVREVAEAQKRTEAALMELAESQKRTSEALSRLTDTIGHDLESVSPRSRKSRDCRFMLSRRPARTPLPGLPRERSYKPSQFI